MSISSDHILTLCKHAENSITEDESFYYARQQAQDLGVRTLNPAEGAAISLIAGLLNAKTVVEIGTGTGISGLWLLKSMRADGVLTTIDDEPEHHRAAKLAFTRAGIASTRTRLINGKLLEVLGRLAENSYDAVLINTDFTDLPLKVESPYLQEGLRVLRPGGALIFHGLLQSTPPDLQATTEDLQATSLDHALTETMATMQESKLLPVLLPLGKGLLIALSRP